MVQLAKDEGLTVIEKRSRAMKPLRGQSLLYRHAVEVTPIRELDDRFIGAGTHGPVITRMQARCFDLVAGRSETHRGWLTSIAA